MDPPPPSIDLQAAWIAAWAGIIGALLGGVLGVIGTWLVARQTNAAQQRIAEETNRAQRQAFIDSLVLKIIDYRIEHPHLEKDDFCQKYPDVDGHANGKERYEAFCTFVFNTLMAAYRHYGCDAVKLGEYIGLEEIVRCHYRWWQHDLDNLGYDENFRQCVQGVIDSLRLKGKIK